MTDPLRIGIDVDRQRCGLAPPIRRRVSHLPNGLVHAVPRDSDVALCGREPDELVPDLWESVANERVQRCTRCMDLVPRWQPTSSATTTSKT